MTVTKVCVNSLSNLGHAGCDTINPFLDVSGLLITSSDFSIDTYTNLALQATFTNAIKAGTMFVLQDLYEMEDQSTETQYYESPNERRIPRRNGKYRYLYKFILPFEVHKRLQSFTNANVKVIPFDNDGNIKVYSANGVLSTGFSVSMIKAEKMSEALPDGTPAFSPLVIDFDNAQEWNEYGVYVKPTWSPEDLRDLAPVDVAIVGSASATAFTASVYYDNGLSSDGSVNNVGIAGLVKADFLSLTAAGASQDSAIDTVTDNGDGTYTFACTGFATGTLTLVAPASLSSGLLIKSSGTATVTVV